MLCKHSDVGSTPTWSTKQTYPVGHLTGRLHTIRMRSSLLQLEPKDVVGSPRATGVFLESRMQTFDERGKMQVFDKKEGKLISLSPGEYADLLQRKHNEVNQGGGVEAWMDLMGLLITGFPAIIQALRLTDAMTEVDTN